MTSNHDGTGRPFIYTVRSQRPSNAEVSDTPDAEQVTTTHPLNAIVKNQLFMTQNFFNYSVRRLFDGLATAAFNVWNITVIIVISNTVNAEKTNGNG